MYTILVNAYAISPKWGSEPGMGWNWIANLACFCDLHVITEGEWRDAIEESILAAQQGDMSEDHNPTKLTKEQADHLHFYYLPVSDKVRKMCWNQGDYRFYLHYAKWQEKTLEIARSIIKENKIDLIHQLNMVGFREPGLLWKIKGIPFVWGPFSGCMPVKMSYVRDTGFVSQCKYLAKNCVNWYQFRYLNKVRNAFKYADGLITTDADIKNLVQKLYNKEPLLIPETGLQGSCVPLQDIQKLNDGYLNLLWVGRFIKTKKLDIALKALANLKTLRIRLYIAGFGNPKEEQYYKQMASDLGIRDNVVWLGKVENAKVKELMRKMDLFFFTSVLEATSTVIPEAIQNRLPIVCHDCCGFGPIVTDKIGWKIPLLSPQKSVKAFSDVITHIYNDRDSLRDKINNFDDVAEHLTYESKGLQVFELYKRILKR